MFQEELSKKMSSISELTVFAASAGNLPLVIERVSAGADLNYIHPEKGSALYAGIRNSALTAYLLSAGADPNLLMPNGETALDHALSMICYYTGQPAAIIKRHGGITHEWTLKDIELECRYINCNLWVNARSWYRIISCGQVVVGPPPVPWFYPAPVVRVVR